MKAVCLKWAPAKISAEPEDFKEYGAVVMGFLAFLGDGGHIDNAEALIKAVDQIKERIPIEAAKESNWGMAKSTVMKAIAQGYDLSSEEDIRAFMEQQQAEAFLERPLSATPPEDPFKGIGRNQKITVRYTNGEVRADIKFKKVEKDLGPFTRSQVHFGTQSLVVQVQGSNLQGAFSTLSAFFPLNPSSFCSLALLEGKKLRTAAGGRQIGQASTAVAASAWAARPAGTARPRSRDRHCSLSPAIHRHP